MRSIFYIFISMSRKDGLQNHTSSGNRRRKRRMFGNSPDPQPPSSTSSALKTPWSRAERPCDACRRRKTRCVPSTESTTACNLCFSRNKECTFVEDPPRSRKRQKTESQVGESSETRSSTQKVLQHIPRQQTSFSTTSPDGQLTVDDHAPSDDNTILIDSGGLKNRRSTIYLGRTACLEPLLIDQTLSNRRPTHPRVLGTFRHVSPGTFLRQDPDSVDQHKEDIRILDEIERTVNSHGHDLVTIFFRIVHPSFPVLHKKNFLEMYARNYREFEPLLLIAVYILALNWWSYSPVLSMFECPDITKLEKLVPTALMNVANRPKISTVQALLLLLQRPNSKSWALIGHLVATGQDLGLNLDCTNWNIPQWEKGMRKRLAWAVFMQDTWGSMMYGRTLLIHKDNWLVRQLEELDFEDDDPSFEGQTTSEVNNGNILFIQMVSLTTILTEFLRSFFTFKSLNELETIGKDKSTYALTQIKPIQLKLKDWFTALPTQLRMHQSKVGEFSSYGYLHLAYFSTEITIHRLLIHTLDHAMDDPHLIAIVRKAAQTRLVSAVQFVAELKPEHLQGFWYFASTTNFCLVGTFGCLLWSTSMNHKEATFYRMKLSEYRWHLQLNSKAADFMKVAIELLDASTLSLEKDNANPSAVLPSTRSVGVLSALPSIDSNFEANALSRMTGGTDTVMNHTPFEASPLTGYESTTTHPESTPSTTQQIDASLSVFDMEDLGTIWDEPGLGDYLSE